MIYLGADHGGFYLKEQIKQWLTEWGYKYKDMGARKLDPVDDYPQFALAVAEAVAQNTDSNKKWSEQTKGILLCRSAIGVVVAANKVMGIRAAAIFDENSAKHGRTNDDINVIALAGDWLKPKSAKKILKIWLETEFSDEPRYIRRIRQISEYERKRCGRHGS